MTAATEAFSVTTSGPGRTLVEATGGAGSHDLPQPPAPQDAPVDRLGDRLRAMAARKTAAPVYEYPLPGWDGLLVVRYGVLDETRMADLRREAVAVEGTRVDDFYASVLVAHCQAVLARDDDGHLVSADLSQPDRPAPRYDERLCAALGWEWNGAEALCKTLHGTSGYVVSAYEALEADCGYGRAEEIRRSRGNA